MNGLESYGCGYEIGQQLLDAIRTVVEQWFGCDGVGFGCDMVWSHRCMLLFHPHHVVDFT